MPLQKCSNEGKSGWQWGDEGRCYTGKDAKKQAIKQGVAIEGPEKFAEKASEEDFQEAILSVGTLAEKVRLVLARNKATAKRYIYEDPKTGEVYTFNRRGGHKKNGRMLVFVGEE